MKPFLEESLSQIIAQGEDLSEAIFVLPSQRACVFLRRYFIDQSNEAGFLPRMIPIEKFIEELSGLQQIEPIPLLFEAYEAYVNSTDIPVDFIQFSSWASMAIQDFNEIDRHLVDAKAIFDYLGDIKRIEEWNVGEDEVLVKKHFRFMSTLFDLYKNLRTRLFEQGKAYQGMLYREAESQIHSYIESFSGTKMYLLGFNALNKAEEFIFQELLENGIAEVYWDADEYYLENEHIAGAFLRKYRDQWPYYQKQTFPKFENRFKKGDKKIIASAVPRNISQVKHLGELLEDQIDTTGTAVVLADENLIGLTLNSLPSNIEKLNITMGYPLRDMPLSKLFEGLMHLYRNAERLKLKAGQFYYRDVMNILSDGDLQCLLNQDSIQGLKRQVNKENMLFLTGEYLSSYLPEELMLFFNKEPFETHLFINRCLALIEQMKPWKQGIQKEYLFRFFKLFNQLQSLHEKFGFLENIALVQDFFKQLLSKESLSFQGEPLEGLQLMGMLETRSLDFENIFMLGVNEGILPSGRSENSFIPFDVKLDFDLPTYIEKDGIYAYHFFRLIQRSKKVYLSYNSETDGLGSGEQSRFITMLELDDLISERKIISPKVKHVQTKALIIEKTKGVQDRLLNFARSGVSPSSLNTFVNNPPQFYFEKLLKVYEADKMEENLALNTMGTIIHDSLEDLYKPYLGKILKEQDLLQMKESYQQVVDENFEKSFKKGNFKTGKNRVNYEVALTYVQSFLDYDLKDIKEKHAEIQIISLEEELETYFDLKGFPEPIKLKGTADRIDLHNGKIRIIDYKTGKVKPAQLLCKDFENLGHDSDMKYVLQVMFYTLLYRENHPEHSLDKMQGGIVSFKNFKDGFMTYNFAENGRKKKDSILTQERYDSFILALTQILEEVFVSKFHLSLSHKNQ